jgi:hypothetical protein
MSKKLPIELLATWTGKPAGDSYEGIWPVPGTRYKLSIKKHEIDTNAVGVQILARADESNGSSKWNWASIPFHYDSKYPLSVDWSDLRSLDDSPLPKADWV